MSHPFLVKNIRTTINVIVIVSFLLKLLDINVDYFIIIYSHYSFTGNLYVDYEGLMVGL